MKSIWAALFLVLFLLCGCTPQQEPETVPPETVAPTIPEPESTEPVHFYDPDNALTQATGGALQVFPLGTGSAEGIRFLGNDILLFSGYENTKLTLLTEPERSVKAEAYLPCSVSPTDPAVTVNEAGVTYVDSRKRELVFLDETLEEQQRIPLPEGCETAAVSADRKYLYYFTLEALRMLELETGIDRLLKEMSFSHQELTALHRSDTVLQCSVLYGDGVWYSLFLCVQTGKLLYEGPADTTLWTWEDFYFTVHMDGQYRELISGTDHFGPSVLVTPSLTAGVEPVPQWQGAVLYDAYADSTLLDYYDLRSGSHPYHLSLSGFFRPVSTQPDPEGNGLWFLCFHSETQQDLLCFWDLSRSETDDSSHYLQSRYTQDAPDETGLSQCALLAQQISQKYGVEILIWADAAACQNQDYTPVPEYQVPLIRDRLEKLDETLTAYPEGLLANAVSQSGSKPLRICLVRSILRKSNADVPESPAGLQFWDNRGNAWLAITPGPNMEQHLYHELSHILDSRVRSVCSAYDSWNALNPEGFDYDYSYLRNLQRSDWELTSGDSQCFIDLYAMSYPHEDRARIMEYAMLPGQSYRFEAEPMQAKLRQLCLGIREGFQLQNREETFLWEQYLKEPLDP